MLFMLSMALTSSTPRLSGSPGGPTAWLSWSGGVFGAIFIATAIFMVPRLGAATVPALIVVGQMLGSLTFDHFGLLGIPQHPASPVRLIGTVFLILGVVLIRRYRAATQ
jgi:transporter family-2 protein